MSKPTGIRSVRWWTSPSAARYLERLECRGDATPDRLAADCHNQAKYAINLCRLLRDAGVIHVTAWRHNVNGAPTPIYRLGPGRNRPAPPPETIAQRMRRRRQSLVQLYGAKSANLILGTARQRGRVVQDGRTLRPGDHDSQLAGKVTR